ncbi:hypothetical protein QQZ08_005852 [Neonectria magnoliae]|uniref:Uncharacterized protein n=1 Tax=Neonectria magnoliae TaxID=2732573 RepID=A0ABR1I3V6_9HYPO
MATATATSPTFSPLDLDELAEIWASEYPELFMEQTTTEISALATASYSLSSKAISTTTLIPLYDGEPIETITQYKYTVIELGEESTDDDSTKGKSTGENRSNEGGGYTGRESNTGSIVVVGNNVKTLMVVVGGCAVAFNVIFY